MSDTNDAQGPKPYFPGDDVAHEARMLLECKGARVWLSLALTRATPRDVLVVLSADAAGLAPNWFHPSFQSTATNNDGLRYPVTAAMLPEAVAVEAVGAIEVRDGKESPRVTVEGLPAPPPDIEESVADARQILSDAPILSDHVRVLVHAGFVIGARAWPVAELRSDTRAA